MEKETDPKDKISELEREDRQKTNNKLHFENAVRGIFTLTNLRKKQIESVLENLTQFQINLVRDSFVWKDFEEAKKFAFLNFTIFNFFIKGKQSYYEQLKGAEAAYDHLRELDKQKTKELEGRMED